MYDPQRIEDEFQELDRVLSGPATARWRLLAMGRFLEQLDGLEAKAEPQLLRLAVRLPDLLHDLDPIGLAPEKIASLMRRFEHARVAVHDLDGIDGFDTSMRKLPSVKALTRSASTSAAP